MERKGKKESIQRYYLWVNIILLFFIIFIGTQLSGLQNENLRLTELLKESCVLEAPVVTECVVQDINGTTESIMSVSVVYPDCVVPDELLEVQVFGGG